MKPPRSAMECRPYSGRAVIAPYLAVFGSLLGLLCHADDLSHQVHLVQQIEVDGEIVETIDLMPYTGDGFTTSNATVRAGYIFTHWSTSTDQEFESRDPWGRAYEQVAFSLYEPMTNTAHYVSEDLDSDKDEMPDGYEIYWYGSLEFDADSDTDGDGIGFMRELELGLNPHFADDWRAGLRTSSIMPQFFKLTLRCEPEGTIFTTTTENKAPGVTITTMSLNSASSQFAYWTINGVEQRDGFGRALDTLSFEMPTYDVEIVAVCEEEVIVRNSLYWYGNDTTEAESDTDGDGWTLEEEIVNGTNPLFADKFVDGVKTASRAPQFFKCIIRCEPEGMLFATMTNNTAQGLTVETGSYNPQSSSFAYWMVDGIDIACRDDFGRALDKLSFEMPTNDVEVVAVCRDDERVRNALYWYGDETIAEDSDTDGDGYTFAEEIVLGMNPLFADAWQRGVLCVSKKPLFFTLTIRSEPDGELFATETRSVCHGVIVDTSSYNPQSSRFAYWMGTSGIEYRDDFGRALDKLSFAMPTNDVELVAVVKDDERVRHALYWYGDETVTADSDTDGDGYTFAEEIALGLNPLFADEWQRGIVSRIAAFQLFNCIIRSEPEGVLFATQTLNIGPGVTVTTPSCDETTTAFAGWYTNGVRQADDFGRAWNQISFTMPTTNVEAVAITREDERTQQSQYWYGVEEMSDESDTDGDGYTFAEEMINGTNPLFADTNMLTGVRYALSEELEADLQPFEQMRGTIVDGEYEELFTSPLAGNEGTSFGENACALAMDVDGDGHFDLVVVSASGTRVLVNKGAAANPDFSEMADSAMWDNFKRLVSGMTRPIICGASGVIYVSDNGGAIYKFTIADCTVVDTGLVGIPGVLDDRLIALGATGTFSCAEATITLDTEVIGGVSVSCQDIDADGKTDILVSDSVGHIWLYRNVSTQQNIQYNQLQFKLLHKVWAGTGIGFAEGMTISLVDWEDDGDYDVVIGRTDGTLMLLRDPRTGRPTNVRAYPGADNVLLEWDPNSQPRIRGYNVYRSPDFESYSRIVNQTPLPKYRDVPSVLQDYWYQITGVSRFYIAGNSTPTVHESMPTDAVYVQFRPSVWLNDTSSFTGTNVEMIVSMNNSMGISSEGPEFTFEYDQDVLDPVTVKTTGLTDSSSFEWEWDNGVFVVRSTGGEIKTGAGMFLKLVFYVKPGCGVTETTVSLTAAKLKALDGRAIALDLPKGGKIEIAEPVPEPEPAIVSVMVDDAVVESEQEFELAMTVTSTEKLTNFVADVVWDEARLELRGASGSEIRTASGASQDEVTRLVATNLDDIALLFYALDPQSAVTNFATTVTLTNIVAVDINDFAVSASNATGTVLIKNAHPWVPATVSISTEDKKVDTLEEVTVSFKITSNEAISSGEFTIDWDEEILVLVGRGVPTAPNTTAVSSKPPYKVTATSDFALTFLAKDQHEVTKTEVKMTAASVTDCHGFVVAPSVPVVSTILIHDAHPLLPAEVAIKAGTASVKSMASFILPVTVTSTKTLTNLAVTVNFDENALELKSVVGATADRPVVGPYRLTANRSDDGSIGEQILLTFYAKDQHTIKETAIELSDGAAVCTDALAANVSLTNGKVLITDSNPPVAPTFVLSALDTRTESGEDFIINIGTESVGDLAETVFTIEWDSSLITYKSIQESATVTSLSANSRQIVAVASGTDNRYHLTFTAAKISDLRASSWVKVTAASATGANGLAAELKTALPVTATVLIVREINKYDPGDIDGDGKYTDADLDLLNKYIAYLNVVKTGNKYAIAAVEKYKLTGKALKAADVNEDGSVDANDISALANLIAAAKEVGL